MIIFVPSIIRKIPSKTEVNNARRYAVKAAKPVDKPLIKLSDEKGLYLLVTAAGGKLWRLDYRFESKRKTLALGSYPEISLKEARAP